MHIKQPSILICIVPFILIATTLADDTGVGFLVVEDSLVAGRHLTANFQMPARQPQKRRAKILQMTPPKLEREYGIKSAAAVPVSFGQQSGMIYKLYAVSGWNELRSCLKNTTRLEKCPLVATGVDRGLNFECHWGTDKEHEYNIESWEGFIEYKCAGEYTFTVTSPEYYFEANGYNLEINNSVVLFLDHQNSVRMSKSRIRKSVTVTLNKGWNKIVFTGENRRNGSDKYMITYLPKGVVSDPHPLNPNDLFYDQSME